MSYTKEQRRPRNVVKELERGLKQCMPGRPAK